MTKYTCNEPSFLGTSPKRSRLCTAEHKPAVGRGNVTKKVDQRKENHFSQTTSSFRPLLVLNKQKTVKQVHHQTEKENIDMQ